MAFLRETRYLSAFGPDLPARAALGLWDRAQKGQTDSRTEPQTHGAKRNPYTWQVGSVSSRPSLQTQDKNINPRKSPSLQFHPPHPTDDLALTSLSRRRSPSAQEVQAVSTAQQP